MESLDPLALSLLCARARPPTPPSPEQGGIFCLYQFLYSGPLYDWNCVACVFCGRLLALDIVSSVDP